MNSFISPPLLPQKCVLPGKFSSSFSPLLATSQAAPAQRLQILRTSGAKQEGSYIVKVKDGANKKLTLAWLDGHLGTESKVTQKYEALSTNLFAGEFSNATLEALLTHKDIEYVAEDSIQTVQQGDFSITGVQSPAQWGLHRISHPGPVPPSGPWEYITDDLQGNGVDVYVLDTGVNTGHSCFAGRAVFGYSSVSGATADGNGHGTHLAGVVGCTTYGVARKAKIIAVKVLGDTGSGATSGIIAGVNYVAAQKQGTGRPSVMAMAIGGSLNTALNSAVTSAINAGVHAVVAAGGSNTDASNFSPASVVPAITVGQISISDVKTSSSNYGSIIDIWAPGQNIISAWIGSTTATNTISGSPSVGFVAGAAALYLSQYGNLSPPALIQAINANADYTASGLPVIQVPYV